MSVTADVAIIMGSQSDWETMRHAADTLEALGISFDARIVSAIARLTGSLPLPKVPRRKGSRSLSQARAARLTCPAWLQP